VTREGSLRAAASCLCVMLWAMEAHAQSAEAGSPSSDPAARAEYEHALALYQRGQYAAAIAPLRRAYELYPSPELLYDLAQAQRLAGDCAGALVAYRAFVATEPEEPLRSRADAKLLEMERCVEQARVSNPPPANSAATAPVAREALSAEPASVTPASMRATLSPAVTRASAAHDRTPYVVALAAVSLGAFAVSGVAYTTYSAKNQDAEAVCPHSPPETCAEGDVARHNELVREARTARAITYAGLGTGVAAAVASLALVLWPRRDAPVQASRWSLQADAGARSVWLGASSSW
jgi:tetratricopeptide (TPR) repeat protein